MRHLKVLFQTISRKVHLMKTTLVSSEVSVMKEKIQQDCSRLKEMEAFNTGCKVLE